MNPVHEIDEDMLVMAVANAKDSLQGLERYNERQKQSRVEVAELYGKFNDEFPQFGETLYAANNALVEYEDHFHRKRHKAYSTVFGVSAVSKKRAYAYSMDLIQN